LGRRAWSIRLAASGLRFRIWGEELPERFRVENLGEIIGFRV